MHPNDWWDIRLTKDGFGRYILGDPQQGSLAGVGFGVQNPDAEPVRSGRRSYDQHRAGHFPRGHGQSYCGRNPRPHGNAQIDGVDRVHSTFFTQNLIAIRAEKRLALVTRRAGSFVTGTFTTSP